MLQPQQFANDNPWFNDYLCYYYYSNFKLIIFNGLYVYVFLFRSSMNFVIAAYKNILAVNHCMLICKNFSTIEIEQSLLFSCCCFTVNIQK